MGMSKKDYTLVPMGAKSVSVQMGRRSLGINLPCFHKGKHKSRGGQAPGSGFRPLTKMNKLIVVFWVQ